MKDELANCAVWVTGNDVCSERIRSSPLQAFCRNGKLDTNVLNLPEIIIARFYSHYPPLPPLPLAASAAVNSASAFIALASNSDSFSKYLFPPSIFASANVTTKPSSSVCHPSSSSSSDTISLGLNVVLLLFLFLPSSNTP